jgi:hypothetical protein
MRERSSAQPRPARTIIAVTQCICPGALRRFHRRHQQHLHAQPSSQGGAGRSQTGQDSLVIRPHAQHANGLLLLEHRLHQLTLDVDSPRIGAIQVANQFLIGRGNLKRMMRDQLQKLLGLGFQTGGPGASRSGLPEQLEAAAPPPQKAHYDSTTVKYRTNKRSCHDRHRPI